MTKSQPLGTLFAITFVLAGFSASPGEAAPSCAKVSYSAERARLQKVFATNAFLHDESAFLLKGLDRRLKEMPQGRLNARGAQCGIQAVRALVLGCMNEILPSQLASTVKPAAKTGKAYWGKDNVSRREALVIGMANMCRASATDALFSNQ
ncbi:hypothetical protein [Ensifer sp.]|uniref:hypothetical protein n=1 Tax=Ensifer sp. TaxID=1872086 RepID=UPI002E0EA5AE|nr:hypothetical protein [Ensifer sp.]